MRDNVSSKTDFWWTPIVGQQTTVFQWRYCTKVAWFFWTKISEPWRLESMVQLLTITPMTNQMKALQSTRKVFNWKSRTTIYQTESDKTHDSNIVKIIFIPLWAVSFCAEKRLTRMTWLKRKNSPFFYENETSKTHY